MILETSFLFCDHITLPAAAPADHPCRRCLGQSWNRKAECFRRTSATFLHLRPGQSSIIDFDQFTLGAFNQCENSNSIIMTIDAWNNVHPMLKTLPVDWDYTIPYGLLHAPVPSPTVQNFLDAVAHVLHVQ